MRSPLNALILHSFLIRFSFSISTGAQLHEQKLMIVCSMIWEYFNAFLTSVEARTSDLLI